MSRRRVTVKLASVDDADAVAVVGYSFVVREADALEGLLGRIRAQFRLADTSVGPKP